MYEHGSIGKGLLRFPEGVRAGVRPLKLFGLPTKNLVEWAEDGCDVGDQAAVVVVVVVVARRSKREERKLYVARSPTDVFAVDLGPANDDVCRLHRRQSRSRRVTFRLRRWFRRRGRRRGIERKEVSERGLTR